MPPPPRLPPTSLPPPLPPRPASIRLPDPVAAEVLARIAEAERVKATVNGEKKRNIRPNNVILSGKTNEAVELEDGDRSEDVEESFV